MKNIYLLCGKSGSGKTTIVEELSKKFGYKISRIHPSSGIAYNDYCQTIQQLNGSDLYVIDMKGSETAEQIKQKYQGEKSIITIYINASESACIERMERRGYSESAIWTRLVNDAGNFIGIDKFTDFIVDGDGDNTWEIVADIINECEQVNLNEMKNFQVK